MQLPITKSPENWTETDLDTLCKDRIPENQRLEYKKILVLEPPRERREFLKDITALANSTGGVIIYGIDEVPHPELGSIAGSLIPLSDNTLIDKATRIVRSNVSPGLEFYIYTVPAKNDGFYIITYVPESYNKPHAIIWEKKIDYYVRRNQDNVPLTEQEIRQMYWLTANTRETLHQRYIHLDKLQSNPEALGICVLTCMPVISNLEIANTLKINRESINTNLYLRWFDGTSLRPFVDRFEVFKFNSNSSFGIRLFQDGTITYSQGIYKTPKDGILQLEWLAEDWIKFMSFCSEIYSILGYWGPIRLWLETIDFNKSSILWSTNAYDNYRFEREQILVKTDGYVDDLANAKKSCIPFVRYFMQGCKQDWSEKQAENWLNKIS